MRDNYKIDVPKLSQINFKLHEEYNLFKYKNDNFKSSYFYGCSDSTIISMRNEINKLYSKIDNGYNKINEWLKDYINENNNLESSLTDGVVKGITDHQTNMLLSMFVNKNKVNIEEAPNTIEKINPLPNTNLRYIIDPNSTNILTNYEKLPYIIDSNNPEGNYRENATLYGQNIATLAANSTEESNSSFTEIMDEAIAQAEDAYEVLENNPELESILLYTPLGYDAIELYNNDYEKFMELYGDDGEEIVLTYEAVKKSIDEAELEKYRLQVEIDKINQEEDQWLNDNQHSGLSVEEVMNARVEFENRRKECEKQIESLDKQISKMQYDLKIVKNMLNEQYYSHLLLNSSDYQNYLKNYNLKDIYDQIHNAGLDVTPKDEAEYNDLNWIAYLEHCKEAGIDMDEPSYNSLNNYLNSHKIGKEGHQIKVLDFYEYTEDENYRYKRDIYNYIFITYGSEAANEYISTIVDDANKVLGFKIAQEKIFIFDGYYRSAMSEDSSLVESIAGEIAAFWEIEKMALEDGLKRWDNNLDKLLEGSETIEAYDYARLYIMNYLKNNTEFYDEIFSYESELTSFIPAIVTDMDLQTIGLSGLNTFPITLTEASIMGDGTEVNCFDPATSLKYLLLFGASDGVAERYINNFPGLSEGEAQAIRNIAKNGLSLDLLKDYIQKINGENIDLGEVDNNKLGGFLIAATIAGNVKIGSSSISFVYNGKRYDVNLMTLKAYFEEFALVDGKQLDSETIISILNDIENDNNILRQAGVVNKDNTYNYFRLKNLIDTNPKQFKKLLKANGYSRREIKELFKNCTNDVIARNLYYKRKREILTAKGYSEEQILFYLRHDIADYGCYQWDSAFQDGVWVEKDGIRFVSDSEEGLLELLDYYDNFKKYGDNKELIKVIEYNSRQKRKLVITNLDLFQDSYNDNHRMDFSFINVGSSTMNNREYSVLSHEMGHYLKYLKFNGNRNTYDLGIKGKQYTKQEHFSNFQGDYYKLVDQIQQKFNNEWSPIVEEEINNILYDKYGDNIPTGPGATYERQAIRNQLYNSYVNEILTATGYASISDIYDALGFDCRSKNMIGHGPTYYSDPGTIDEEIMANLSQLYFNKNWDLLYNYFPKELVDQWETAIINLYK